MGESSRKYQNGKIYCIRNNVDDDIYVGSTTQPLSKRMAKHRGDNKKEKQHNRKLHAKINELGIEHFYIELLEKYECNSNEELHQREGKWIREIATLNHQIAGRTRKESAAEYHANNKEAISQRKKQYRQENEERERERLKKDYENRKVEINARRSEKHDCECGGKYTTGHKSQHFKSKMHQTYLKQKENIEYFFNIHNIISQ